MRTLLLLTLILILPSFAIAGQRPPNGWRFPKESDYAGDWRDFREELPVPFHVKADFNGDKITDDAWMLIRTNDKGWGLFVFLNQKSGRAKVVQLDDNPNDSNPQRMGIALAQKGRHKTACGKGYWACKRGEPEILILRNAGIEYFVYEVSSSIYYWDRAAKRFNRVWISD